MKSFVLLYVMSESEKDTRSSGRRMKSQLESISNITETSSTGIYT